MIYYSEVSPHTNTASPMLYLLAHYEGEDFQGLLVYDADLGFSISDWPSGLGEQPSAATVLAWVPPAPEAPPDLTDVETAALTIQSRLDQREFERTGHRPDQAGAVPRTRALAAAAMSLGGWGYPSVPDLTGDANTMAILAALYADPTSNTTSESSDTAKRRAVQYVRILTEGGDFGEEYSHAFSCYERTASPLIRTSITNDERSWMELACGPWETVRAMFLALLV